MTRSPRHLKEQVRERVSDLPIHAARLAVLGVGKALVLTERVRKDYRQAREVGLRPVVGRLREDAGNLTGKVVHKVTGRLPGRGGGEEPERPARESEIVVGKPTGAPRAGAPKNADAKPTSSKPAGPKPANSRPPGPRPAGADAPGAKDTGTGGTKNTGAEPTSDQPTTSRSATEPRPGTVTEPRRAAAPTDTGTRATEAKPAPSVPPATELPVPGYDSASIASVRARLRALSIEQVSELRDYERTHAARAEFLRMFENRIAKLRERHG